MPHIMPALKIPSTTEQLSKQKAKKQVSKKTNCLMLLGNQIVYLFLFKLNSYLNVGNIPISGECILQFLQLSSIMGAIFFWNSIL